MSYVDGFVVPVPKKNARLTLQWRAKPARSGRTMARSTTRRRRGRRQLGQGTSPRSVKMKGSETVWFSLHRLQVAQAPRPVKEVMKDKRLASMMDIKKLPFDAKRMISAASRSSCACREDGHAE